MPNLGIFRGLSLFKSHGSSYSSQKVPLLVVFVQLKPRASYVTTYKYAAPPSSAHPPTHSLFAAARAPLPPLLQTVPHLSFGHDVLPLLRVRPSAWAVAVRAVRAAESGRISKDDAERTPVRSTM